MTTKMMPQAGNCASGFMGQVVVNRKVHKGDAINFGCLHNVWETPTWVPYPGEFTTMHAKIPKPKIVLDLSI